ncbi:restriction endonuclease [Paenibacillus elgii]|uniref:restriction endonuclease n=1 Tax=Paenibacillus elgii TaxID=189691 RepID=UPI0013D3FE86|nr:restriction endonuclease [Paenibacillus elgii]NEN84863.1 hypothetical protein [Paenibacillus elgii]
MGLCAIEVVVSDTKSTTFKGNLLEQLGKEVLETMQYDVIEQVRITGAEIDLFAVHKVSGEKIYVECKAHKDNLSADVLSKIIGNVLIHSASSGWLLTTGPLGKDAKGSMIEWESRETKERKLLQIYTADRLIKLLISTNKICSNNKLQFPVVNGQFSDDHCLLITEYGRFWAIPIININTGTPYAVMLFSTDSGEPIKSRELIVNVSKLNSTFKDLEWIISSSESNTSKKLLISSNYNTEESQAIVKVSAGDQWADYRPSRPEDFVGREDTQSEVFRFLDSVRLASTSTRLFALKAPSGWGKSSVVLKLVDRCKNTRNKGKYFMYAVDVRAAVSQRYGELALVSCIKEAISSGFIKEPSEEIKISSTLNPFTHASIAEVLDVLRKEEKVIALVFDQFEEIFSKKELSNLFENIRSLCSAVDGAQENFVLGFAWKSDGHIPQDHPAYFMWHNHADRRKEFTLGPFSTKDISKALSIFTKEIGTQLNPILKRHLIDHCQGYPWLLKKLCIHVFNLVKTGIDQLEVLGKGLNIKELFEKDLTELSSTELSCINKIAIDSPADFFQIEQIYSGDIVHNLINRRLVLRKGDRLILYWDIFRDYVITKEVPNIPITYIPQTEYRRCMGVLKIILEHGRMTLSELTEQLGIKSKATENVIRDLVMIGTVERNKEIVSVIQKSEFDSVKTTYLFLKNHVLTKYLLEEKGTGLITNENEVNVILRGIYPSADYSEQTWKIYTSRILRWLDGIGILFYKSGNYYFSDKPIRLIQDIPSASKRGRLKPKRLSNFLGEAPPSRVLDLINKIKSGQKDEDILISLGYRNSISLLYSLDLIQKEDNILKIVDSSLDYSKLADVVREAGTIKLGLDIYERNPNLNSIELGEFISKKLGKTWSQASIRRYGNALLQWIVWLKNPNYQIYMF